jgi:hypothetical protein
MVRQKSDLPKRGCLVGSRRIEDRVIQRERFPDPHRQRSVIRKVVVSQRLACSPTS